MHTNFARLFSMNNERIRFWKTRAQNSNHPSTVLLVKLLISNWLYFVFRLGCSIDEFTAKNNNMRLYTIFLYTHIVIMIVTHNYEKMLSFVRFYLRPKRYCVLYDKINFTFVLSVSILMVCCYIRIIHIYIYMVICDQFFFLRQ